MVRKNTGRPVRKSRETDIMKIPFSGKLQIQSIFNTRGCIRRKEIQQILDGFSEEVVEKYINFLIEKEVVYADGPSLLRPVKNVHKELGNMEKLKVKKTIRNSK